MEKRDGRLEEVILPADMDGRHFGDALEMPLAHAAASAMRSDAFRARGYSPARP